MSGDPGFFSWSWHASRISTLWAEQKACPQDWIECGRCFGCGGIRVYGAVAADADAETSTIAARRLAMRMSISPFSPRSTLPECRESRNRRERSGWMQLWGCRGNGVCNMLFKGTARSIGEKSDK
jgi:hypothetical protein